MSMKPFSVDPLRVPATKAKSECVRFLLTLKQCIHLCFRVRACVALVRPRSVSLTRLIAKGTQALGHQ